MKPMTLNSIFSNQASAIITCRKILAVLALCALTACSTPVKKSQNDISHGKHYAILDILPKEIEGFSFVDTKTYPDPLGYSLRYRNNKNQLTYADIYIYPIPKEAIGLSHKELVLLATKLAFRDIEYVKKKGSYSRYDIISNDSFGLLGKTTVHAEISILKDNLVLYSLLYVTESNGKWIKARLTMPDNEANRNNETWHKFVTETFSIILQNIENA